MRNVSRSRIPCTFTLNELRRSHGNRVATSEEPAAAPSATSNIIQGKLRRVDKAIIRAAARFDGTMAFVEYDGEKGLRQTVVWKINVLGLT